tara:strand:- start:64 stop:507 length:444 start_codon:yes stop_codon:yes gene_type:complete
MTTNRKAHFKYNLEDSVEAGIVLNGSEIKSIREGKIDISQAFCRVQKGEIWLHNSHIGQYKYASAQSEHEDLRSRKLLLHKNEILKWDLESKKRNLIIVPLKVYLKRGRAKVQIGLGKSKKIHDKRSVIRNREAERDIERSRKASRS